MAEYIDREKLLDDISAAVDHRGMGEIVAQTLTRYVKRQPPADVAPVVHGEWRTIGANFDRLFCSSCGQAALPNVKMLAHFAITFKFCPLCGAKMDGGDPDGR